MLLALCPYCVLGPSDPAFTVKDSVDSGDEDVDSEDDSDDGGDSVIGRDLDDHSDAGTD